MKLILGIGTFNRNAQLRRLLDSLEKCEPRPLVVVCDNTPDQKAKSVVPADAVYLHCPARGISHVRNALLDFALFTSHDALIFLDDDEIVAPDFIEKYMAALSLYPQAAYIASSVHPLFTPEAASMPWFKYTPFYRPPSRPEGRLPEGTFIGAGNVLLRLSYLRTNPVRFDPAFNLSGGEDSLFFFMIQKGGGQGFWIENPAYEHVPDDRATLAYFYERSLHTAAAGVRAYAAAYGKAKALLKWFPKMLAHALLGYLYRLTGYGSEKRSFKAAQHLAVAKGQLYGLTGRTFEPYAAEKQL